MSTQHLTRTLHLPRNLSRAQPMNFGIAIGFTVLIERIACTLRAAFAAGRVPARGARA